MEKLDKNFLFETREGMRVLLIARTLAFGGGAEKLVFETYAHLKKRLGNQNVKLVVFQPSSMFNMDNVDYYEKKLVQDENFIICDKVNVQLRILKKNKIENKQLIEIVYSFKPDIIHTHLFIAELYARTVFYPQAKWVTHFHDNMPQFVKFSLKTLSKKVFLSNYYEKKFLFKRYYKNGGTKFIAVSKNTHNFILKHTKKYDSFLLENAIDLSKFQPATDRKIDSIRIINIGSFMSKKNQVFFIKIAQKLLKHTTNFKIKLLGDGPLRGEVEKQILEHKLENFIEVIGLVSDVHNYLQEANIYVHTATYEPMGLVLVEAMASGLPIVTLNGKGNSRMVINDENGYMIEKEDSSLFSASILKIVSTENTYHRFSKTAIEYSKKYDINIYIDKLLSIYSS